MKSILFAAILAMMTATSISLAEEAELDRPSFTVTQTEVVTAVVAAINVETREVSLELEDGSIASFVAREEARNLDQVMVGDIVVAETIERLDVQVYANDGGEDPTAMGMTTIERAAEGDMPGVAAIDTEVITAVVEDINIEANTFKLRGPDGTVEEYTAMNPDNLKRAKVGDIVVITMTEAVAISVMHAPDE